MDNNSKNQIVAKLKEANNVLVTVSTNPSVDQLTAAIGLTLFLTRLKKHSTTVFSGEVPSTIEFLKPEKTIESNTDSLRDFIIALDKSKADKIRYKVEDTMVKIFITPYRTSIGETDLVFSQGDFNVDVVIGLGVHNKEDLDQAITSHGRILHDATVATINTKDGSEIGNLNWVDPQSSSLCEMVVVLTDLLKPNSLDGQMATALLTGIVAETERFSNSKTSSATMNASAKLMAAGANQQLVATKLAESPPPPPEEGTETPTSPSSPDEGGGHVGGGDHPDKGSSVDNDGALRIDHEEPKPQAPEKPNGEVSTISPPPTEQGPPPSLPQLPPLPPNTPPLPPTPPMPPQPQAQWQPEPVQLTPPPPPIEQIHISDQGDLQKPQEEPHITQEHRTFLDQPPQSQIEEDNNGGSVDSSVPVSDSHMVTQPPAFGGAASAATTGNPDEDSTAINLPQVETPILSHNSGAAKQDQPPQTPPAEPPLPPPWPEAATIVQPNTQAPLAPPPMMPSNLPQAAEPPIPTLPPPTTQPQSQTAEPFKFHTPKADHPKIETTHDKPHGEQHTNLPPSVISVMDDQTLNDIEKAVDSPHRTQLAKAFDDKTLNDIETTVDGHHTNLPGQVARAMGDKPLSDLEQKVQSPHLQYEAIESEPPDSADKAKDEASAEPKTSAADEEKSAEEPKVTSDSSEDTAKPQEDATPSATETLAADAEDKPEVKEAASDSASDKPGAPETTEAAPAGDEEAPDAKEARDQVAAALAQVSDTGPQEPIEALGTTDLGLDLGHTAQAPPATPPPLEIKEEAKPVKPTAAIHIDPEGTLSFPTTMPKDTTSAPTDDPLAPPPVPPPLTMPAENSQKAA